MTSSHDEHPYVLSYRRDSTEEDRRLDSQHEVIQHGILDGLLVHPSIRDLGPQSSIADLGCGTGIWLDDVANTLFAEGQARKEASPLLVGFDTNARAFNSNPAPGVQLVEHDCTKPFDTKYTGKFDLVNIRGLAYAVPRSSFPHLIENAIQLLKPGGYLQWLETEARLFRAYPATAEISEALEFIKIERQERDLVSYLPHFMLRELLSPGSGANTLQSHASKDVMCILNFNLLPGGISRETPSQDATLNERFSDIVLESISLFLNASSIRGKSQINEKLEAGEKYPSRNELTDLHRLMGFIDEARKSDTITMGGFFPQVIAQKNSAAV